MPLVYQQNINDTSKLALWHITENEDFFSAEVSLLRTISHPHKRLQHLAGRYLLKFLEPGFPLGLVQLADKNKPFLPDDAYHFSIAHCGDYAAVILSTTDRVGIDIETVREKISAIQHKFISENELQNMQDTHPAILTLAWSAKEALFKWYGKGQVDFIKHLEIKDLITFQKKGKLNAVVYKDDIYHLQIQYRMNEDLCLCYIIGDGRL